MELIILGSGTCVPSLTRGSPASVVRTCDRILLIDSGSGTLERLLKVGITIHDVDMILYTHTHPDHVADLVPFLFASKYDWKPRHRDLTIIGGKGFSAYFEKLQSLYGKWIESDRFSIDLKESIDDTHPFPGFRIITKPMDHLPESIAFRIETDDGKAVVVSGDTDHTPNLIELAADVDLLVLESAFPDENNVKGHLSPSLAGQIASESRCKKLVLTHLYPICEGYDLKSQCASTYKGPMEIAHDLMRFHV
ncbi:MAG: MBL fold metallo-hydrolase [Proteobacteria bacterium]|nr:MBL fold metallo-hydrolase [Pseudomonadota bacterium]